jgi:hypothetical protein
LNSDDERISTLFILEFLEALALGPYTVVPVRDLLGVRGKNEYDELRATRLRTAGS